MSLSLSPTIHCQIFQTELLIFHNSSCLANKQIPPLSDHLPLNILTHHPGSTLHGQSSLWLCPLQATLKIIFLCIFSSHLYLSDCPFWLLFVLNTSLKIGNNGYKRFYQWTTCFSLLTESHIMRHYEFWNSENDWNHSFKASFSVLGD